MSCKIINNFLGGIILNTEKHVIKVDKFQGASIYLLFHVLITNTKNCGPSHLSHHCVNSTISGMSKRVMIGIIMIDTCLSESIECLVRSSCL